MGSNNQVANLANWRPPTRTVRGQKGRPITEKLPPMPARKVVDLDGNVVYQPHSNGISNRSPQDPYGLQSHNEKLYGRPGAIRGTPGGIVPFNKCPRSLGLAPYVLEDAGVGLGAPCQESHEGKAISNDSPCSCIVKLIAYRQAAAAEKAAESEERINKLAKLAERTAEANLDAASQMAEAAKAMAAALSVVQAGAKPKKEPGQ